MNSRPFAFSGKVPRMIDVIRETTPEAIVQILILCLGIVIYTTLG